MAIIKYKEVFRGILNMVWEEVKDPNKKGVRLAPKEARKRIKEQGLVLVVSNEHGKIWDTPDGSFYELFKGVDLKEIL